MSTVSLQTDTTKNRRKEKMKIIRRIIDTVTAPFIALAVNIDESRRNNEDGSWDKYNERKNRRESRKVARRARKSRA